MKRKSPRLALAISLTPNISFFPLLVVSLAGGNVFWGPAICCLVTDGYGQYYNGEWVKGLKFLAWAALSAVGSVFALSNALDASINHALGYVMIVLLCIVARFACGILAAKDAYRSANRLNMTPEEFRQSPKSKHSR